MIYICYICTYFKHKIFSTVDSLDFPQICYKSFNRTEDDNIITNFYLMGQDESKKQSE